MTRHIPLENLEAETKFVKLATIFGDVADVYAEKLERFTSKTEVTPNVAMLLLAQNGTTLSLPQTYEEQLERIRDGAVRSDLNFPTAPQDLKNWFVQARNAYNAGKPCPAQEAYGLAKDSINETLKNRGLKIEVY
jgi:hypothetical protein